MRSRCSEAALLCLLAVPVSFAGEGLPPLALSVEASRQEYPVGCPVLLKLTLRNTSNEDYTLPGPIGWGRHLTILSEADLGDMAPVRPDVRHGDTKLGPVYMPTYCFSGALPPGKPQAILQMVPTKGAFPGRLHFAARLGGGRFQWAAPAIAVTLVGLDRAPEGAPFTEQEKTALFRYVVSSHNYYRGGIAGPLMPGVVRKALRSEATTVDIEYALYAGIFLAFQRPNAPVEVHLAREAAEALLQRFPESRLRAHACSLLFEIYLHQAREAVAAGQALPEATPLYDSLDLPAKLRRLGRGRIRGLTPPTQ